jgi:uncharacterized membrane protein YdcZ (DUF606 family)
MVFENIILVLAGILTALVTGLYFGYSVSVNGGLHRLIIVITIAAFRNFPVGSFFVFVFVVVTIVKRKGLIFSYNHCLPI